MVGFYVLALVIAGALIAIPFAEYSALHRVDVRLAFFGLVGGAAILKAIVPRIDRFDPPGPQLTAHAQPRLFAAIEDVALKTEQEMPREVFLVSDVNAWVTQRGGFMGFGSHRVMGLGLPLMQSLSVDELRAILAHEFGHYHGGDTALGPWIYKTRAAIGRTLESLSRHSSMLMKPFEWYGAGFLRITHAISRRQEYAADALAARTVGATPMATGLRTIHGTAGAFHQFWSDEVGPLVGRGYQPPLVAGFSHFLGAPLVAESVTATVEREMASPTVDPYDTHPTLRDRLTALQALGLTATAEGSASAPRAITLLDDVAGLEAALIASALVAPPKEPLKTIDWKDAGSQVWVAIWREQLKESGRRLDGVKISDVPGLIADLKAAAAKLGYAPKPELANAGAQQMTAHIIGCALSIALIDRGWTVSALPGEIVVLSRDGESVEPFADLSRLSRNELTRDSWLEIWKRHDLADIDFGTLAA